MRCELKAFIFVFLSAFAGVDVSFAFDRFYGLQTDISTESHLTTDGGLILTGMTISATNFYSGWLLKLDSNGVVEWQKKFDSRNGAWINSVTQTNDGGYIFAGITGGEITGTDAWIVKLESNGDIEWERNFGGPDIDDLYSIKQLSDGTYVAAGSVCPSIGTPCDGFVTRLLEDGTIQWLKTYNYTSECCDYIYNIEQTGPNELLATGASVFEDGYDNWAGWLLRLDLNGGIVESNGYDGADWWSIIPYTSVLASDGRVLLLGYPTYTSLMKLSSSGEVQWQKQYTPIIDGYPAITFFLTTIIRDGNDFVVGGAIDNIDNDFVWVMKIDASGSVIWSKVHRIVRPEGFESSDRMIGDAFHSKKIQPGSFVHGDIFFYETVKSVHVTGSGNIIASGWLDNSDCGGDDFFVAELDSDGNSCFFSETNDVIVEPISFPTNLVSLPVSGGADLSEFAFTATSADTLGSSADACSGFAGTASSNLLGATCGHTVTFDFPTGNSNKVLIHKYGSDSYPQNQTQDRRVKIKATVRDSSGQPVDGHWVYFTVKDPPDSSVYVSNPSAGGQPGNSCEPAQ